MNLVAAELLKLRTRRTALVFAGVALALLALSIALGLVFYAPRSRGDVAVMILKVDPGG